MTSPSLTFLVQMEEFMREEGQEKIFFQNALCKPITLPCSLVRVGNKHLEVHSKN